MPYQTSVQNVASLRRLTAVFFLLAAVTVVIFSGCEAPTAVGDVEPSSIQPGALLAGEAADGIFVGADDVARPLGADDIAAFSPAVPGERNVSLVITGRAAFDYNTVPELRLNVRQTQGGAIGGQGGVTLRDQTTGFTPVCVKKRDLWGRSYYGITMELDEPHNRYGRTYEYAVVTVTDEGQLSPGVIFRHSAVCGYSAALYPKAPVTGYIEVVPTGQ